MLASLRVSDCEKCYCFLHRAFLSLYRVETEIGNLVDVAEDGDFGSGGGDDDEGEV